MAMTAEVNQRDGGREAEGMMSESVAGVGVFTQEVYERR